MSAKKPSVMDVAYDVVDLFIEKPRTIPELVGILGHTKDTMARHIGKMRERGLIVPDKPNAGGKPRVWTWQGHE